MNDVSGTIVSVSYTKGHMVVVSDAVVEGKATTIVSIARREDVGHQQISFTSAETVLADATDGSLTIRHSPVTKVTM